MPKANLEDVRRVLTSVLGENAQQIPQIMTELEARVVQPTGGDTTPPTEKRDVVVLLAGENNIATLTSIAEEVTAIAFKIDSEDDHNQLIQRVVDAATSYNAESKRRSRVGNFAEACAVLSPKKHLDGFPLRILNKEPALVLVSENVRIGTRAQMPEAEASEVQ